MSDLADHQSRLVEIRGIQVELSQIEAMLRSHDEVADALVIAREDRAGVTQLVGYVTRRQVAGESERARAAHIRVWQRIYDSTYRRNEPQAGDFNISGWNSTYTGKPIPAEEMKLWVDEAVSRIRTFAARRVLEIGCGTGLLLTRVAQECESYVGVDFSSEALKRLQTYISSRPDLEHVVLREGPAHDLAFVPDGSVDLVVLNSVVQYFPDASYLLQVLREASRVTCHGGHIFVGDVRSLPLLEAFHASVQLHKANGTESPEQLKQLTQQGIDNETELALHPEFFENLNRCLTKVGRAEIWPKFAPFENEISLFRYDAIITIGAKMEAMRPEHWLQWDEQSRWTEQVKEMLSVGGERPVGVHRIADARVSSAVTAAGILHGSAGDTKSATEWRTACAVTHGEHPQFILRLAESLGVTIRWTQFAADGTYAAIFNSGWKPAGIQDHLATTDLLRYVHAPCRSRTPAGTILQSYLRERLPECMVPSAIINVEAWPLSADGLLDRAALPGT